jgi:TonB-dependent receptor
VQDEEVSLHADFERDMQLMNMPSTVKLGFKYRARQKDADFNIFVAEPDVTLADFRTINPDHEFSNTYGAFIERKESRKLEQYFATAERDDEASLGGDFVTDEDILSLYGMATMDYSSSLRIVAGLRLEQTDVSSSANQLINGVWTPSRQSRDYLFVSPSVNLKYSLNDNTILRAAYSRSLSRPGFSESAPSAQINSVGDERSIQYGNFDLEHLESDNLDFTVEYYADEFSYVSAGLFFKSIDNAIYPISSNNRVINGVLYNDGITTWENLDSSSIKGLEFNVQRQFNFLPGILSNAYASATCRQARRFPSARWQPMSTTWRWGIRTSVGICAWRPTTVTTTWTRCLTAKRPLPASPTIRFATRMSTRSGTSPRSTRSARTWF